MKFDETLRITGSLGVILAYFTILHIDTNIGVVMHLIADGISIPYFVRTKTWDVVVLILFLTTISVTKLVSESGLGVL